jgi:hypothetical protein
MKRTIFWDVTSKKVIFFDMHSVFCEVGIEILHVI